MEWLYVLAAVLVVLMLVVLFTGRGASSGTVDEIPLPRGLSAANQPATGAWPTAEQLTQLRFTTAFRGYSREEVDVLIEEIIDLLRHHQDRPGPQAQQQLAARVADARFAVVLRGYRMEEVDAALAHFTDH